MTKLIRPKLAKRLGLIAPAFHFDQALFEQSLKSFEQKTGIHPVYDRKVFRKYYYFAGTDDERLGSMLSLLKEPSLDRVSKFGEGMDVAGSYNLLLRN